MAQLTRDARNAIKSSGITIAAYIRDHGDGRTWHGDKCGCSDDRCIGHHYDEGEECRCLPVLIRETKERLANA